MAIDTTVIFNMALATVGIQSRVALPTETSPEAEECSLWYELVRDIVLQAAPWPEAKATVRLALLAERATDEDWVSGDPDPGYLYVYSVPSDYLYPRHLSGFQTFEETVYGGNTKAIATNVEDALLVYTRRVTNESLWSAPLTQAVVGGLAGMVVMGLTGKRSRAELAITLANQKILDARVNAANRNDVTFEAMPPWITARGYGGTFPTQSFIYPDGPLLALQDLSLVS